jgi:hypothetical protein
MEKSLQITRSGKAGRESGSTKEIQRKHFNSQFSDLRGKDLLRVLCMIVMNTPTNEYVHACSHIRSEINMKLRTYKASDLSRSLPGSRECECEEICEMMIEQKCKCYYCHTEFLMLYKNKRDPLQWSVDRIDNSRSHCEGNIVISCLQCNLKRRTRDCTEFYNCKNLNVHKEK